MNFLAFNALRNTFKSGLVGLVFLFVSSFAFGGGGCIYVDSVGVVVCSKYSSSGTGDEALCKNEAAAAGSIGGLNCPSYNVDNCASQIFSNPFDTPAHTYCFFNGNNNCLEKICAFVTELLPIDLISFKGKVVEEVNYLDWSTESEINNSHYIILHSTDGEIWTPLSEIPGAGNSSYILSYRFIDRSPQKKINYYKLIQVDYDGKSASYGPISIDNRDQKRTLVKVCNMLGQEVNENYRGIVIYHYSDGSYEKIYR